MSEDKSFPVYTGRGKTITVTPRKKTKVVDMKKLQELYDANSDKEVYTGMKEDWFFTAIPIKSKEDIDELSLRASCWATPVVEIDDSGDYIDCYIEVEADIYQAIYAYGFRGGYGEFDFWLTDFFKRYRKLDYENTRAFFAEVKESLEKYESVMETKNKIKEKTL
jgi:hypothetical protein